MTGHGDYMQQRERRQSEREKQAERLMDVVGRSVLAFLEGRASLVICKILSRTEVRFRMDETAEEESRR
jgi:hypothetical protein